MKISHTIAFAAVLAGCAKEAPRPEPAAVAVATTPEAKGAMPKVDHDRSELMGTVAERLSAGSYTYLSVHTAEGAHWVVTLGDGEPVGTTVSVKSFGIRQQFRSRRLDRTFDELRFGIVRPAS